MNSHLKGKVWENTNIPKLWVSYVFQVYQKPIQFPNHGWISLLRNKYEKTQAIPRFCSTLFRAHAIPNVRECTNSHNMEIFFGKPCHSQALNFWRNLLICFPSSWKIERNTHIFPIHGYGEIFPANPYDSQSMRKVNFDSKEKIWENTNNRKLKVRYSRFENLPRSSSSYENNMLKISR